ncbi:MAG: hypothetical protein IPH12_06215 [Saprospirales bacterium]|nr:hypothetical protein [Saprospirales bacterium]
MKKYLNLEHWTLTIGHITAFFLVLFAVSCQKNEPPEPPETTNFSLYFQNDFNLVQARYAAFVSDSNGLVRAFRWLPGSDTASLSVPDALPGERFDCTVVQIIARSSPGTGIADTAVRLTTYTHPAGGTRIRLRDPNFLQSTDVDLTLTGLNSLDSILVPEGLTFVQPQASNNFQGKYRVLHTGRLWLRLRINGEAGWRYAIFDQVSGPGISVALDASALPAIPAVSATITLPLLTTWEYQLDRIVDAGLFQFFPIGDPVRVPGGAIPVFDQLDVFEPPNLPFGGYRLQCAGYDGAAGVGYICDRSFVALPNTLPEPAGDIARTTLADARQIAVRCTGAIDLLAFTRQRSGTTQLAWEVLMAPLNDGIVLYRLPDVPAELADMFPALKNYAFDPGVRVRAECYDLLQGYSAVVAQRLSLDDPLWQMKAGYTARERIF